MKKEFPNVLIVMATILLLALSACTPKEKANEFGIKTVTVVHKDFQAEKPVDWTETEIDQDLYKYTPKGANTSNSFGEYVTVLVSNVPKNNTKSLLELMELGLSSAKIMYHDLTLAGKAKHSKVGTLDGLEISFSATVQDHKMQFNQILAMSMNRMYTVTYTCPAGSCNNYNVFYSVANSLKPTV